MDKYRFFEDPGHGWLAVPRSRCQELGILDKISQYSYQSNDGLTLYLEEDCDFGVFLKALRVAHSNPSLCADDIVSGTAHGNMDWLRNLRRFEL